jgi:uridine phosphorylase
MVKETLYLKCRPGDVAPLVLLSGDPARVERLSALLDAPHLISRSREYSVLTGRYQGVPVSAISGGIGAPSTAIVIEELVQLGVRSVVRIGTMMGVRAPLGSVVLSLGAARFEGTSAHYLPLAYPAIPHWSLVHTLAEAGRQQKLDLRMGLTATFDAFYPDMAPTVVGRAALDLAPMQQAGVLSMDMETSLIFTLGAVFQLATASMCLVTVQAEPHTHLDPALRSELDDQMVRAALTGSVAYKDG